MERSKSILKTPDSGQGRAVKNSVSYPSDSKLLQIVPPSGNSVVRSRHGGAFTEDDGGRGGTRDSLRRSLIDRTTPATTAINMDALTDDATPSSAMVYDRIDFSSVFGDEQGNSYLKKGKGSDGEGDSRRKKPDSEQKKHKSRKVPEQRITIFALRLALIEKAASGIGTLAFLWATVVILGGFATTVRLTDFWVVSAIILAEGSRIFSRSHELEWQQLSSKSNPTGMTLLKFLKSARSFGVASLDSKSKTPYNNKAWFRRSRSAPDHKTVSPESGESDMRTPTNSSSSTSRHNRRQAELEAPKQTTSPSEPQKRTWSTPSLPLLPFMTKVVNTHVVSRILYFVQLASAMVCIGLSVWRLSNQKFYNKGDGSYSNVKPSMNIFYSLSVLEASLFLLERSYWEYRYRYRKLLEHVRIEAELGHENADTLKQFFYDVYSANLKGSVFDGLEMDLVAYSISWLLSEDFYRQLGGARLLNRFVSKGDKFRRNDPFAADALRRLGTTPAIIERLVEMLSWNSTNEEELLHEVSTIICRLVVYSRNCSRFVAVPGATDGLVSLLLHSDDSIRNSEVQTKQPALRLTGLRILKYLCIDHKNSLKIGETRGLLSILFIFIEVRNTSPLKSNKFIPPALLRGHLKTYKKSLQVLGKLAAATNSSGGTLRHRIGAIVTGLTNLRDVIEFGEEHPELQRLSIEILYDLAMEEDLRSSIAATGGVVRNLFKLFAQLVRGLAFPGIESDTERDIRDEGVLASETAGKASPDIESDTERDITDERVLASETAGKTLTRLVLQNETNAKRLLQLRDLVPVMVKALYQSEKIASSAAKVLRSVLNYADESTKQDIARGCAPVVLNVVFKGGYITKSEMYEASLGLASRALQALAEEKYLDIHEKVDKPAFVQQLIKNLQHTPTTNKYPRIRRYSVELILALIEKDNAFLDAFQRQHDLLGVLEKTVDSISAVENFCLFSGLVGYTRHSVDMEDLVKTCIERVENYHNRSTSSLHSAP